MLTVLVSVTDKSGLEGFLKRLERFDTLRLIATTSTASHLELCGFKCTRVEELTGFPEILSGRVKTLHPKVFAGILARPSTEDRSCLAEMEISEIDLVVVNLYRFESKLGESLSEPEMVEQIDVGGVALLRAAAKNFERVAVVCEPTQYDEVIAAVDANQGKIPLTLRRRLALASFERTARYDRSIADYLSSQTAAGSAETKGEGGLGPALSVQLARQEVLRYGENPHQAAAWYRASGSRGVFPPFEQLQGKEMSSNNITDTFALFQIIRELKSPAACIIKHNNPCGVAQDADLAAAFEKAYDCDPLAAFGGVYGFTGEIDGALAERIVRDFVEIVFAPAFTPEALAAFSKKKNLRVLRALLPLTRSQAGARPHLKDLGEFGVVVEVDTEPPVEAQAFKCVTRSPFDQSRAADVAFAWSVVKHLTSNAIFVAGGGVSLGFGIGQTSRIGSVDLALAQAGKEARGAVLASDAFFPAIDNIESAAKAGIAIIVQPGGSLKDPDVIEACDRNGITMLFTGQRCFKH